jgi:hypothetical protein
MNKRKMEKQLKLMLKLILIVKTPPAKRKCPKTLPVRPEINFKFSKLTKQL